MPSLVYKQNKVPYYQRQYMKQHMQGVRLWTIHPRSPYLLYPFLTMISLGAAGGIYGMIRMAAGKKTYY